MTKSNMAFMLVIGMLLGTGLTTSVDYLMDRDFFGYEFFMIALGVLIWPFAVLSFINDFYGLWVKRRRKPIEQNHPIKKAEANYKYEPIPIDKEIAKEIAITAKNLLYRHKKESVWEDKDGLVKQFLSRKCEKGKNYEVKLTDFRQEFHSWCIRNEVEPPTTSYKWFPGVLRAIGFKIKKARIGDEVSRVVYGVRTKASA